MAEPQVQYAKTSDGVSIAYAVAGSGPPLVYVRTYTATHVQLDWELVGTFFAALAAHRTLIMFDRRGAGLSDREVSDLTLGKLTLDLEAVVDQLGLERFALMGTSFGMMVSTIYALRHPERVSALISFRGVISGSAYWQAPRNKAMRAMRETDYYTYVETITAMRGNPRWSEIWRASVTPEGHHAFVDATEVFDVTDLVSQLNLPVLLLHPADGPTAADEGSFAREMATRIPGARLVAVPLGEANQDRVASALDAFLGDAPVDEGSQSPSGTAIILFADIADSTALTELLGDAAFRAKARELDDALRRAITSNGGTAIDGKLLGDGVLATFGAAREAIACAAACHAAAVAVELALHVGIHAGDVIREANNVYGGAVNIASRISELAAPGEVLVSRTVADLARTSAGVTFEDRGDHELKGIDGPVRVFAVRSQG